MKFRYEVVPEVDHVMTVTKPVAAWNLGVSVRHLERLIKAGRVIPPVRLGRLVVFPQAQWEAWIRAGCPQPRPRKVSKSPTRCSVAAVREIDFASRCGEVNTSDAEHQANEALRRAAGGLPVTQPIIPLGPPPEV